MTDPLHHLPRTSRERDPFETKESLTGSSHTTIEMVEPIRMSGPHEQDPDED